jgi:hypothetical protein
MRVMHDVCVCVCVFRGMCVSVCGHECLCSFAHVACALCTWRVHEGGVANN